MRISDWSSDVCSSDLATAHISVFQRTPAWIIAKPNWTVSRWRKALYRRLPISQQISRVFNYWRHELFAVGFTRAPALLRVLEEIGRASCRESVCQYVEISGVAVSLKKKIKTKR